MRYLGLLRGLPGSSKSTFIADKHLESYTLSSDDYRLKLGSPTIAMSGMLAINQQVSGQAWKNLNRDLEYRMSNGEFTIIDATNISAKEVSKYRALCKKYFYRLFIVDFTDVPVFNCIARDKHRGWKSVGADVINRMNTKLNSAEISKSIKIIKPLEFNSYVSSLYKKIDLNNYNSIHVIGDIHGCYKVLKERMDSVDLEKDAVIFVGDYFDRGIQNAEVFKYMDSIKDLPNVFMCIGNHEQRILKYLRGEDVSNTQFYNNTLVQLMKDGITDKMIKSFCRSLITCAYFTFNDENYIVSHGGLSAPWVFATIPDSIYIHGVGKYEDMQNVCDTYSAGTSTIQIFGHRNNEDVPIKINDVCYNVCGFPEYGGELKSVQITRQGIKCSGNTNDIINDDLRCKAIEKYPNRFKINVPVAIKLFRHSKFIRENKFGNISSFNFTKDAFYDGVWNGATVKARGLFINTTTNDIVARSYDKFFLLNQHECSTIDNFEFPLKCYRKYDGFLGILGYDKETDELVFCSKSMKAPEGEYAQWFKDEMLKRIKDVHALKYMLRTLGTSLIFEVIIPDKDEHIIKYDKTKIVLLDMVNNTIDCSLFEYDVARDIVKSFINDFEEKELIGLVTDKSHFIGHINTYKSFKNMEGFVFVDKNNHMFKLKTYDYEIGKLTRNQQEYYNDAVNNILANYDDNTEQAVVLKVPEHDNFCNRYINFYTREVVEAVYNNLPAIIFEANQRLSLPVAKI